MRNLLNESFARLYRNKTFRVCLVLAVLFPALLIMFIKLMDIINDTKGRVSGDDSIFLMFSFMPLFVAIAAGLFVAKDFRQNTVRNKIICGYSRTKIYLTNLITCSVAAIILHFASMVVSVGLTSILYKTGDLFTTVNLYYLLISITTLISFTSVTVMMTMIFRNTAGAIFSFFIHQILTLFDLVLILIKNKALKKFLDLFPPQKQLEIICSRNYANDLKSELGGLLERYSIPQGFDAVALPLYAVILIVIVSAVGILHFNKSDVK